ncbi:MAG: hypothetical protein NZ108_06385 [Bacteroidia bacterium]|nr:hypothetical protein [Bacteroidia bacterium]
MEQVIEILKYSFPGLVAIGAAYTVFAMQIKRETVREQQELRLKAFSTVIPLRLQAYERAVLYLERIHPVALLQRNEPEKMTANQLKMQLTLDVQAEYDHNVVQQLYISDSAWSELKRCREAVLALINQAAEEAGEKASGIEMSRILLRLVNALEQSPVKSGIDAIKRDLFTLFPN